MNATEIEEGYKVADCYFIIKFPSGFHLLFMPALRGGHRLKFGKPPRRLRYLSESFNEKIAPS